MQLLHEILRNMIVLGDRVFAQNWNHLQSISVGSLISILFLSQDGATFLSLPQSDHGQDFFTHKTNSSSASGGNESLHSDPLITPPSDGHFSSPNKSKSSSGSGVTVGSYVPNWNDFFPPPPNCPPSDNESTLNTPLINRNHQKVTIFS